MKVSVQYAQEHLADLAIAVSRGEDVEIDGPGNASFRLTLVKPTAKSAPRRPRRELWGAWEGLVAAPTQEEWDAIHQQFLNDIACLSEDAGNLPPFSAPMLP